MLALPRDVWVNTPLELPGIFQSHMKEGQEKLGVTRACSDSRTVYELTPSLARKMPSPSGWRATSELEPHRKFRAAPRWASKLAVTIFVRSIQIALILIKALMAFYCASRRRDCDASMEPKSLL